VAALNVGAGQRGNAVNGFLERIERILPVGIRSIRFYNPLTVLLARQAQARSDPADDERRASYGMGRPSFYLPADCVRVV
jgi:hypothetical protein